MSREPPLRVLIVTVKHWWLGVSRLPMALHQAGFSVAAWCPDETFVARSGGIARHFRWDASANWRQELGRIFEEWRPHVIIPADETIAVFLRTQARRSAWFSARDRALRRVLHDSLGDPQRGAALDGKIGLQRLARSLGIATPDDRAVADLADAQRTAAGLGFPLVLKDEFAAGGTGVKICENAAALDTAWRDLDAHTKAPSLRDRVRLWLKHPGRGPAKRRSVQRFIRGRPAFHAVLAWQGRRLGGITAVVEVAHPPVTGPSCVVRLCELPEVSQACSALIAHTRISGLAGFDFMIEDGTGRAYILECNPRPTPVSHLGGLVGNDLCALWRDALLDRPVAPAKPVTADRLLAFFPQELLRDAQSPYLARAHLDFPTNDPQLLSALRERFPELAMAMHTARDFLPPEAC